MLTQNKTKKVAIVGVGNLIQRDDGIGVHVVNYLERCFHIEKERVALVDAGTAGIYMAPVIESSSHLFIIDAVNLEAPPGTIKVFSEDDLKAASIHTRMSPHQVGILEILDLCRLRMDEPPRVKFITIVPKDCSPGTRLSPEVKSKIPKLAGIIKKELYNIGIHITRDAEDA